MSVSSNKRPIISDEGERQALYQIAHALEQHDATYRPMLIGPHGEELVLPECLCVLLRQMAQTLAQNKAVTLVPVNEELTTQEAADILNISRPYLIKLLEEHAIPFHKVGTHRRIRISDLMSYKKQRDEAQAQALDRLAALNQELGLYDC